MKCPICTTEIDETEHKIIEKLGKLGYLHLDTWVKCPKCKFTPCFGKELSDAKPVYFFPSTLPRSYKKMVTEAFHKYIPAIPCIMCGDKTELHKAWINSWKRQDKLLVTHDNMPCEGSEEVRRGIQFFVPTHDGKLSTYLLPSGILGQYKCKSQKCKYVRYVTL